MSPNPMRALHVDDLAANRRVVQVILGAEGIDVLSASNGVEALEVLRKEKADVIISDVLMPQMDGFELCRKVKAHPKWQRIPFIVLTATHADPAEEELGRNLGVERFLEQPVDPQVLVSAVKELGRRRRGKNPTPTPTPVSQDSRSATDDGVSLQAYNERLVRELKEKVTALQTLSRELQSALDGQDREQVERLRVEAALRESEAALLQSQKLQTISTLAGGIAHDLDNVLTVVLTNTSLIQAELPAQSLDSRRWLAEVEISVRRGSAMIRKLLAFSRHEKVSAVPVDLPELIVEIAETLRRVVPATIDVRTLARSRMPAVCADADTVEQILVNLATNARDAMPNGGVLTVAVASTTVRENDAESSLGRPGDYVTVDVRDTGMGMDSETAARAVEPFFTTKPAGEGTGGLGLPMVVGLMQQHGGFLRLTSAVGRGTCVRLYFPVAQNVTPAEWSRRPAIRGGNETILLVEDEPFLRSVAERSLRRLGYTVLAAVNGEEGLHVFEENRDRIGLIFSDAVMPKLGGAEMLQQLRARDIDVPFVLTSGYSERDLATVHGGSAPVLRKPWSFEDLAKVVREVLDQRGEKSESVPRAERGVRGQRAAR